MSIIKKFSGHDWTPRRPKDPAPEERGPTELIWAWECTTCSAYAEVGASKLDHSMDYGNLRLPRAEDRKRWSVAENCETESVEKVHAR